MLYFVLFQYLETHLNWYLPSINNSVRDLIGFLCSNKITNDQSFFYVPFMFCTCYNSGYAKLL